MQSFPDTRPQRSVSEGNILRLDDNECPIQSLCPSQSYKEVSKSCQSMSTSVNELNNEVGNGARFTRKPSLRGVRKLMNRIVGSNSTKRSKKTNGEGLVKGGLTPSTHRRGHEDVRSNSEENDRAPLDPKLVNGYADSTRRPLMTRPNYQVALPKWSKTPGTLGIYNHGNTCFMNTVLQCISNTDQCAEYFVLKQFKELLHVKGIAKRLVSHQKGDVTEQLSQLLESLWMLNYSPALSDQFKAVVSKCNSQYKGCSQHDAQEFLLWLLDRLNEELYQSQKKKIKDSTAKLKKQNEVQAESSPEAVLSMAQGFELYNKFQALYRSSLICPNCGKQSNTYESYLCLSLPVPQRCLRPVYITVVYLDDDPKQLRIALEMNMFDNVKELREKLAFELDVTPKRLVLCQVGDNGFRNTFGDDQPLSDIHENEIVFAFETFPVSEMNNVNSSYEMIQILLVHTERFSATKSYRICSPQVIRLPRDVDYKYIQGQILKSMGLAIPDDVIARRDEYPVLFKIHVVDSGVKDCYLPTDVDMPLYTEAIDRALNTYSEEFGPKHVKFIVEWEPKIKDRIIINDDEQLEEHQSVHKVRLNQQQPSHVSLDECLKMFTKEERLSDEDAWSCPFCKEEQRGAIKKLGLWSCPDILVIHLKRFRQVGLRRNKLNILVNFPVTGLEMGRHIIQQEGSTDMASTSQSDTDMYDLYGVSNHYGNINGGHYTAFCKNPIDCQWYEFDDTHVKPVTSRDIVSRAAYLLFYQKRQLTNASRSALHDGTHWIYTLYDRPSTSVNNSAGSERYDRDYEEQRAGTSIGKAKSVERDYFPDDEQRFRDFHSEINSPRQSAERNVVNQNSQREDINSPRQERSYRNVPEKGVRNERQLSDEVNESRNAVVGEQLRVNLDNARSSAKQNFAENGLDFREKYYVEKVNIPRNNGVSDRQTYRRSFSEDSYKNAMSNTFTSNSESGKGYNPLSPDTIIKSNPPSPGTPDSAGSGEKKTLLNNERTVNSQTGIVNDLKLKIHQNELDMQCLSIKGNKTELNDRSNNAKNFNQTKSTNKSKPDSSGTHTIRSDVFATPQQSRKSPSPPIQNGRGPWLTPQPQRKHQNVTDSRPSIERQSSVPANKPPRPTSSYFEQQLENHKQSMLDTQPQSLPVDVNNYTMGKPPLPARPSTTNRVPTRQKSQDGGHSMASSYDSADKQKYLQDSPRNGLDYETRTPRDERSGNEGFRHNVTEREERRGNGTIRQNFSERDLIERARSAERERERDQDYRRSMRVRNERPLSYHQTVDRPYHDSFESPRFERSSNYATIRNPTLTHHQLNDDGRQYLPRHYMDQQYTSPTAHSHQPRSRAPLSYDPYRYQEPEMDMPRYQPHLHSAKFLTKLAMQEQEYLNRKMKSQILKESSV